MTWTQRTHTRLDILELCNFAYYYSCFPHLTPGHDCSQQVHQALLNQTNNCSVLLISNNVSVVEKANRIFVFHEGMVKEEGSHDVLLEKGGLYAELVRKQNMGFHRQQEEKNDTN